MSTEIATVDSLIERVKKKGTLAMWAAGLGTAILAAPLIWLLFYAMLGAAALGIATIVTGLIALVGINYYPVVKMKLENRKIEAIKAEAAANPITTMQAVAVQGRKELAESRAAIGEQAASVALFEQKKNGHKKKFPDDVDSIQQMEEELAQYKQLLTLREAKWRDAEKQQEQFERAIEMMSSRFEAASAGVKANKLSDPARKDIYAKIKVEAAYDSVMRKQAEAFSGLRMALLDAPPEAPPQITNQPADVIDVTPVRQRVEARRAQ